MADRGDSGGVKCKKMPPGGQRTIGRHVVILLCAACTGCIIEPAVVFPAEERFASVLPVRGASAVHQQAIRRQRLCLGAACMGCIKRIFGVHRDAVPLPRRCLHGVHLYRPNPQSDYSQLCLGAACTGCIRRKRSAYSWILHFASALPARGASADTKANERNNDLCLGAACTGCISECITASCANWLCLGAACTGCIDAGMVSFDLRVGFASALPARGASVIVGGTDRELDFASALPARGASSMPSVADR